MISIKINTGLSSGLHADFDHVQSIEIEDAPFASGGFGDVYYCLSINGRQTTNKLVVKIFKDNSTGSAQHNYQTTTRLQEKAKKANLRLLSEKGLTITEEYPAFKGLPQFSFNGLLKGKQETGFCSEDLVSSGFTDFERYLQEAPLLMVYQQLPIERKLLLAYQLVSVFKILEEFHFIHADLKPGAIFINLKNTEIALIDYDSGVITENPNDEPLTWGAPSDWVAPEIWEQQGKIQKGEKIQVDIYSDRWSLAIGIHYLMTGYHPLFYLTELSPRVAGQYFSPPNEWPNVNKQAPYFQKANEKLYDQYLPWVSVAVPAEVRSKIAHTLNYGYNKPVARVSYSEWKTALQIIQRPPKIKLFECDKAIILKGMQLKLQWEVENAHTVQIDNGIGQVDQKAETIINPSIDLTYTITAVGFFGITSSQTSVAVFPIPMLESLMIPAPIFSNKIILDPINISAPRFDLSVKIEIGQPKFEIDSVNLNSIRNFQDKKYWMFNFQKLYEFISGKKNR